MRWLIQCLILLVAATSVSAQTYVSVKQLEHFLQSWQTPGGDDSQLAHQLSSIELSEQLTRGSLARLTAEVALGPSAREQLKLLSISSVFQAPPLSEIPTDPPPAVAEQTRIVEAARVYAAGMAQHLPDFIALRSTRSYMDVISHRKKGRPSSELDLQFVRELKAQIAFLKGRDVNLSQGNGNRSASRLSGEGLTTSGEFGSVLTSVLSDSSQGTITWARWKNDADGRRLAIFRYEVPKAASHHFVEVCCNSPVQEGAESPIFRDTTGYSGELYIDPADGTIRRITIESRLGEGVALRIAKVMVEYRQVNIGNGHYICPVRGVAVAALKDDVLEKVFGRETRRYVNVIHFTDYHKFGSTSKLLEAH